MMGMRGSRNLARLANIKIFANYKISLSLKLTFTSALMPLQLE
jgi:hypothetical protein